MLKLDYKTFQNFINYVDVAFFWIGGMNTPIFASFRFLPFASFFFLFIFVSSLF